MQIFTMAKSVTFQFHYGAILTLIEAGKSCFGIPCARLATNSSLREEINQPSYPSMRSPSSTALRFAQNSGEKVNGLKALPRW